MRKLMVPLEREKTYLEARKIAKSAKKPLPSNVLYDDYLVVNNNRREIREILPAWTRELFVHPKKGSTFRKGKDVVDSETGWILPADCIPKEALRRRRVGLFVDPEDVVTENGRVIVHPKSVILLKGLGEDLEHTGKVDIATRMPVSDQLDPHQRINRKKIRWLYRTEGIGVRPMVRGFGTFGGIVSEYGFDLYGHHYILADQHPDHGFGVAVETGAAKKGPTILRQNNRLIVEGSPEQIEAAFRLLEQLKK